MHNAEEENVAYSMHNRISRPIHSSCEVENDNTQ
uniref:Uncharacterized protein n=1 Tax=Anguilla anguilla TaxID=7936 RepID=A0A0E9TB40_ANGAN